MAERFKVGGLRELGFAMQGLSDDMRTKVARQAVAAGAGVVRKAAREKAPRDTGNLAASLVMKRVKDTNLTEEYIVTPRKGRTRDVKLAKRGEGKLGKDAYYARFVEFGTVKSPAQPFMRPALEENVQRATNAIADRLRARIKKVTGK